MVNLLFKKILLIYMAIALVASPIELLAASKKSNKRISTSQKSLSGKHRVSVRNKKNTHKVSVRLRNAQALQMQRTIEESYDGSGDLHLASGKALIINQKTGEVVYAKNTSLPTPIASITKLMTAMITLDAGQSFDEIIYVSDSDVDYLKGTSSRLSVGSGLSRGDMLQLALMASENRAASAIGNNYPGGRYAFVKAMNTKAKLLGLTHTRFVDPTGLDSENVSTAEDLAKLVQAAYQYPEIRLATTSPSHEVYVEGRENAVNFNNTNGLVRTGEWQIGLSKTGYISEAGRCLVMQATIAGESMIVVLLDSNGKLTRIGDANRVRKWMEYNAEPYNATPQELPETTTGSIAKPVIVATHP
jgi:serine-type D-Ala-D-Ala endopeptidase (penicillin-binding protein 7)